MLSMTKQQVTMVKESWIPVMDNRDIIASTFYRKLFELKPDLQSMFSSDMEIQGLKFVAMFTRVVQSLPDLEDIQEEMQVLSRMHAQVYEIDPEDLDLAGKALIDTLRVGFGAKFTPDLEEAWTQALAIIMEKMKTWGWYHDGPGTVAP